VSYSFTFRIKNALKLTCFTMSKFFWGYTPGPWLKRVREGMERDWKKEGGEKVGVRKGGSSSFALGKRKIGTHASRMCFTQKQCYREGFIFHLVATTFSHLFSVTYHLSCHCCLQVEFFISTTIKLVECVKPFQ
jgi:hypothetical protein